MLDDAVMLFTGITFALTGVSLIATCIAIAAARRSRRALNELRSGLEPQRRDAPGKRRRGGRVA